MTESKNFEDCKSLSSLLTEICWQWSFHNRYQDWRKCCRRSFDQLCQRRLLFGLSNQWQRCCRIHCELSFGRLAVEPYRSRRSQLSFLPYCCERNCNWSWTQPDATLSHLHIWNDWQSNWCRAVRNNSKPTQPCSEWSSFCKWWLPDKANRFCPLRRTTVDSCCQRTNCY